MTSKDEDFTTLPKTSYELIERLDKLLPPRCINLGETLESAYRYAGARELIDGLVTTMKEELNQ